MEKYKVLVSNDDGINANGLRTLVTALSHIAEVYVVAPRDQQSAKSQSVTFLREVEVRHADVEGAAVAFELDGTPADCVKWAVGRFAEDGIKFDFVFSGINHGGNAGTAAYYSGTVAAAMEGALNGIHSVALSVIGHDASHFEFICGMIPELMEMSKKLSPSTLISVNAPNLPVWKVKGIRVCDFAPHGFGERFVFNRRDDNPETGGRMYQMEAEYPEVDTSVANDFNLVSAGYATITPAKCSMSDPAAVRILKGLTVDKDTVAVFVNAQEGVLGDIRNSDMFVKSIGKFAACMNRLDIPCVISGMHGRGRTITEVESRIDRPETTVRNDFSAWDSAEFETLVEQTGAHRVLIAGTQTQAAVILTALDALHRGYEVTVIEDCCGSRNSHEHKVAVRNLREAGCRVGTLESVMLGMLGTTRHPAANSILRILAE